MPEQCRYFDICGLSADPGYGIYCILHSPELDVYRPGFFKDALKEYLESGKTDFRKVNFPPGLADFTGRTFLSLADFREAVFKEGLNLTGARLSKGLNVETDSISGIDLSEATIEGPVRFTVKNEIKFSP